MSSHVRYLDRLACVERSGMKLGLDRFRRMLDDLGHPERRLRTVLIAGTNGKGSVAAIVARILQAGGHRVGLFTSPHLLGYRERVRIDGRSISRAELTECMAELGPVLRRRGGSFFEAMTGLAFLHFVQSRVDVAVFEVGLGGRLDATNVGRPLVSVVVDVSLDHTRILGRTLAAIAGEKIKVARRGQPLVIGARGAALARLREGAGAAGARPLVLGIDGRYRTLAATADASRLRFAGDGLEIADARLALRGRHQVRNAAVALLAAAALRRQGIAVRAEDAIAGLDQVRWPGRLEMLAGEPRILVDGAHNASGARALGCYLREFHHGGDVPPVVAVLGLLDRKSPRPFVRQLGPAVTDWVVTKPPGERGMDPRRLAATMGVECHVEHQISAALGRARRLAGRRGLVCVCGSLRLVAAALHGSGRRRMERI